MERVWQAVGGGGLGLLTGILVGMSSSPVVATVLGAISAALGGFLGFQKPDSTSSSSDVRLGAFGVFCVAAIFLGVYVRAHNLASPTFLSQQPSLREEFDSWKQLPNTSDDQARSL